MCKDVLQETGNRELKHEIWCHWPCVRGRRSPWKVWIENPPNPDLGLWVYTVHSTGGGRKQRIGIQFYTLLYKFWRISLYVTAKRKVNFFALSKIPQTSCYYTYKSLFWSFCQVASTLVLSNWWKQLIQYLSPWYLLQHVCKHTCITKWFKNITLIDNLPVVRFCDYSNWLFFAGLEIRSSVFWANCSFFAKKWATWAIRS